MNDIVNQLLETLGVQAMKETITIALSEMAKVGKQELSRKDKKAIDATACRP